MKNKSRFLFLFFFFAILASVSIASDRRPANWAQPVSLAGVPNLHKVNDGLYRSAQPTAEGMKALQAMGIRTVLNLRQFHWNREELVGTDLLSEHTPLPTWSLQEIDAVRFLRIATDPQKTPVLVHCKYGADRTGALIAVYRIAVQGWTKEEGPDKRLVAIPPGAKSKKGGDKAG